MSVSEMVEFLDLAYPAKSYVVPCLIGPVGIGKTAAVNIHAKNVGAKRVVEIIASQILPTEVSGLKMPDVETMAMKVFDDARLSSLEDGDILFFDELLEADQMVLSACLTLIENRTMLSGRKLPDIQIIAATNPTISPTQLKQSIRQRFLFKEFTMSLQETINYIRNEFGFNVDWDVVEFLKDVDTDEYNFLTPRSLTKAARWIMDTEGDESRNKVFNYIRSIYGFGLSEALRKCYDNQFKKPDIIAKKELLNSVCRNIDEKSITNSIQDLIDNWEDASIEDVVKLIQEEQPDAWLKIAAELGEIQIGE